VYTEGARSGWVSDSDGDDRGSACVLTNTIRDLKKPFAHAHATFDFLFGALASFIGFD
jgi:glycerol-3-phosphate acyltransferase PlsY